MRVSQKAKRGVDQGGSKKVPLSFWPFGRTGPSGLAGAAVLPLASGGASAKMRTTGLGVLHASPYPLPRRLVPLWIKGMKKMVSTWVMTDPYLSGDNILHGLL